MIDCVNRFVARAEADGRATSGHHNRNYVVSLSSEMAELVSRMTGTRVTVRFRRPEARPVVIRTWDDEAEILRPLKGVLPHVPECLVRGSGFAIHSYVEGIPFSRICGNGKPVDSRLIGPLALLLAQTTRVRGEDLPVLPDLWPSDHADSQGFLQTLAYMADRQIREPNWSAYGQVFAKLGIPKDALVRFGDHVPRMTRRPYSLLHADLHRDNLIVSYSHRPSDREPPLICVDWELATYGDPLHDLATHLFRMHYPRHQWDEVVNTWADVMRGTRPKAVEGLAADLPRYIAFEQGQSVYPDVIRAAQSLESKETLDQRSLDKATDIVCGALDAAKEPLGLRNLASEEEIERVLYGWWASRRETGGRRPAPPKAVEWKPDARVPERPAFPHTAVSEALLLEDRTAAGRVFEGTSHINSVVQVEGVGFPVVVRRKTEPKAMRLERSFLSEHAVLLAIERSRAAVAVPRVLALGETWPGGWFTIHTYEGPRDGTRPSHPVRGLLPNEADALVDQLGAMTEVDYTQVDPIGPPADFYWWVVDQVVRLVWKMSSESKDLARRLGLPKAADLRKILLRHKVTERAPALLHGALNPWNLVCRDDHLAFTIIDWDMALVGDPLYDLVRHMHLTPTSPDLRHRMLSRWGRRLAAQHTKDHWADWRTYARLEVVRSAYVDLDRLVTGAGAGAPNVRRALDQYATTLATALRGLGLPEPEPPIPFLAFALS